MISRKILFVLVAAACVVVLSMGAAWAGSPNPCQGGILKVAQNSYPPSLDWHASKPTATREVCMNMFESLVTYNKSFEIVPMLATKWEVAPDRMSYTFHLRRGVRFHNGKEMTSEDVVHSVKRFMHVVGGRKGDLYMVKDVVALDKYTVRFDLKEKTGALLAALGSPIGQVAIMPKEVLYDKDGKFYPGRRLPHDPEHLVGTGPYKFNKWLRDRYVSMTCYEGYTRHTGVEGGLGGDRVGYYKELRFYKVFEPAARVAGVETGQYHFADGVPYDLAMKVKDKPGIEVTRIANSAWPAIKFNLHPDPDGKPSLFSNLKVRQAIMALLDMEEIMKAASEGPGRLDPGWMIKEHIQWTDAGKELYNQANPEKAKRLLKEAGYDGRTIRIMGCDTYRELYKSAVVVQAQLERIGVPTKLFAHDWPTTIQHWLRGGYWDIGFTVTSNRFDFSNHNVFWHSKQNNFGYGNPEADLLVEAGMRETDSQKRMEIYKKLQQLNYEDANVLLLFHNNNYQVHTAKLKGYAPWYLVRVWNTYLED